MIIPFGIPGSGKSTFLSTLKTIVQKIGWSLSSLSSDGLRKELMNHYMETHAGVSAKDAYDKTGKTATIEFNKRIEKLLKDADNKKNSNVHIVFIDKNHPVNGIDKTVTMVKNNIPKECTFRTLYLIPQINDPMPNYPFSFSFLL